MKKILRLVTTSVLTLTLVACGEASSSVSSSVSSSASSSSSSVATSTSAFANVTSVTLSAASDGLTQVVGSLKTVVVTATFNAGTNPATPVVWTVNGVESRQTGRVFEFTPTAVGTFTIQAKVGTVTSNNIAVSVTASSVVPSLTITDVDFISASKLEVVAVGGAKVTLTGAEFTTDSYYDLENNKYVLLLEEPVEQGDSVTVTLTRDGFTSATQTVLFDTRKIELNTTLPAGQTKNAVTAGDVVINATTNLITITRPHILDADGDLNDSTPSYSFPIKVTDLDGEDVQFAITRLSAPAGAETAPLNNGVVDIEDNKLSSTVAINMLLDRETPLGDYKFNVRVGALNKEVTIKVIDTVPTLELGTAFSAGGKDFEVKLVPVTNGVLVNSKASGLTPTAAGNFEITKDYLLFGKSHQQFSFTFEATNINVPANLIGTETNPIDTEPNQMLVSLVGPGGLPFMRTAAGNSQLTFTGANPFRNEESVTVTQKVDSATPIGNYVYTVRILQLGVEIHTETITVTIKDPVASLTFEAKSTDGTVVQTTPVLSGRLYNWYTLAGSLADDNETDYTGMIVDELPETVVDGAYRLLAGEGFTLYLGDDNDGDPDAWEDAVPSNGDLFFDSTTKELWQFWVDNTEGSDEGWIQVTDGYYAEYTAGDLTTIYDLSADETTTVEEDHIYFLDTISAEILELNTGVWDYYADGTGDNQLAHIHSSTAVNVTNLIVNEGGLGEELGDSSDTYFVAGYATASRPSTATTGALIFNTTTKFVQEWSGSAWVDVTTDLESYVIDTTNIKVYDSQVSGLWTLMTFDDNDEDYFYDYENDKLYVVEDTEDGEVLAAYTVTPDTIVGTQDFGEIYKPYLLNPIAVEYLEEDPIYALFWYQDYYDAAYLVLEYVDTFESEDGFKKYRLFRFGVEADYTDAALSLEEVFKIADNDLEDDGIEVEFDLIDSLLDSVLLDELNLVFIENNVLKTTILDSKTTDISNASNTFRISRPMVTGETISLDFTPVIKNYQSPYNLSAPQSASFTSTNNTAGLNGTREFIAFEKSYTGPSVVSTVTSVKTKIALTNETTANDTEISARDNSEDYRHIIAALDTAKLTNEFEFNVTPTTALGTYVFNLTVGVLTKSFTVIVESPTRSIDLLVYDTINDKMLTPNATTNEIVVNLNEDSEVELEFALRLNRMRTSTNQLTYKLTRTYSFGDLEWDDVKNHTVTPTNLLGNDGNLVIKYTDNGTSSDQFLEVLYGTDNPQDENDYTLYLEETGVYTYKLEIGTTVKEWKVVVKEFPSLKAESSFLRVVDEDDNEVEIDNVVVDSLGTGDKIIFIEDYVAEDEAVDAGLTGELTVTLYVNVSATNLPSGKVYYQITEDGDFSTSPQLILTGDALAAQELVFDSETGLAQLAIELGVQDNNVYDIVTSYVFVVHLYNSAKALIGFTYLDVRNVDWLD